MLFTEVDSRLHLKYTDIVNAGFQSTCSLQWVTTQRDLLTCSLIEKKD